MFDSKRPKFTFNLTINELSNIPQVSGYCYIELAIRDGKHAKTPLSNILGRRQVHTQDTPATDEKLKSSGPAASSEESELTSTTTSSGNITTTTSAKKIHNFKCAFNFNMTCNLRFPIKRRENLIGNKYLLVRVIYVNDIDKNHHKKESGSSSHSTTIELGRLEINLAEYLNFKEPLTTKYLLKESKVNSILGLTIGLKELPSNFDFHTQLQINDSHTASSASLNPKRTGTDLKKSLSTSTTNFNVPQFDRKNIFGGLSNVMGDGQSLAHSEDNSGDESLNKSKKASKHSNHSKPSNNSKHSNTSSHSNSHSNQEAIANQGKPNVSMDPIVNNLYCKIMESTWDPELHALLDYSPEKSINDMFDQPDNAEGWNKKLSDKFGQWSKEQNDDGSVRDANGLISEHRYREDLRSWTVSANN